MSGGAQLSLFVEGGSGGLGPAGWTPPRDFPLRLRRSKRSRHLRLEIGHDAVHIVAPLRASRREIEALVLEKRDWIDAGVAEMRQVVRRRFFPRRFRHGARLPYQGDGLLLDVEPRPPKRGVRPVVRRGPSLVVRVDPHLAGVAREAVVRDRVRGWYRSETVRLAEPVVMGFAPRIRRVPRGVRAKWMTTRWGSCGPAGWVNLNARLLAAPPAVLEYVAVHELCHLRHLHHRATFWALVERLLPDYHEPVRWLDRNGMRLLVD